LSSIPSMHHERTTRVEIDLRCVVVVVSRQGESSRLTDAEIDNKPFYQLASACAFAFACLGAGRQR
jgi:hypothetical protein